MVILTRDERMMFAQWCEQEAASIRELVQPMKALATSTPTVHKYEDEANSLASVAIRLRGGIKPTV